MTKRTCSSIGQWVAVAFVAMGLGASVLGLGGFVKHQRAADEIQVLARQQQAGRRTAALSAGTLRPAHQMARFNLLIWTGVQFSFFGVCVGVAAAAINRTGQKSAAPAASRSPSAA